MRLGIERTTLGRTSTLRRTAVTRPTVCSYGQKYDLNGQIAVRRSRGRVRPDSLWLCFPVLPNCPGQHGRDPTLRRAIYGGTQRCYTGCARVKKDVLRIIDVLVGPGGNLDKRLPRLILVFSSCLLREGHTTRRGLCLSGSKIQREPLTSLLRSVLLNEIDTFLGNFERLRDA